jgi:Methane oxygenase PmoA
MVTRFRDDGTAVTATWDDAGLFRYTYRPTDPQLESPRPFFHPVRTLTGDLVSLYRPHDHVWHKGIAWSLPNVGPENFWGGPTYRRGDGYVQLPNNGTMRHESFTENNDALEEHLTWITESGHTKITENRRIAVTAWPEDSAWRLAFRTTMRNATDETILFGSPTTEGRDNAGYGGLFWRGPRSFTGGQVLTPQKPANDAMGHRAPWLAFQGRHDGHGRTSTLVFTDRPGNVQHPCQWFVRSTPYACVSPAPFFSAEYPLLSGASLTLRYDIVIADGTLDASACAQLADRAQAHDPLQE